MQTNILQIQFTNITDKKLSASLFQLFSDNLGLEVTPIFSKVSSENYFGNLKNWLLKNKFDCELIRMQFNTNPSDINCNRIYFKPFMYQSGNPFGSLSVQPLFIVGECFSPKQYQSGIIDVPVDCEFDGFTTDIMFDVEPKETFVLTLFERVSEEKKKAYEERMKQHEGFKMSDETNIKIDKGLTPFKGFPIVVENESDEDLTIDLFNNDHYRKLAEYDKKGKVYIVFQGRENFGIKNVNVGQDKLEYEYVCSIEQMKIKKENREVRDIDDLVKRVNHFDCIRVVNPNQKTLNDIIINGRTIKTAGYVDGNGVCDIAVDVKLDSFYDYDSCIVTVPAKTNMMFSFGKTEEIIDKKPTRMVSHYSK